MTGYVPPCTLTRRRRRRTFAVVNCVQAMPSMLACVAMLAMPSGNALCAQQAASKPVVVQPGAPGAPTKTLPPSTRASAPPHTAADTSFMQGMIMHHSQAVEMTALIPSHTTNPAVQSIGGRISLSQADEIKFMQGWLESRGEATSMAMPGMPEMDMSGKPMPSMPGMLTPPQMAALRQAHGAQFDRLFLAGMIQHHGGALVMVKDLFDSAGAGQDADLFNFATDVDNTQRAEIGIMRAMLQRAASSAASHPAQEKR